MFRNYIKVAFRSLFRQKGYSFINITGLAIGIAGFILISLWVNNELSFDCFHEKKERLYRVNMTRDESSFNTITPLKLGPALKDLHPEIEDFTRIRPWGRSLVKYGDKSFVEKRIFLSDPAFFKILSFPFVYGNPENALSDLNSVVLTKDASMRYFGDINPVGKMLYIHAYEKDFIVGGVIENIPDNSSIKFDMMGRIELMSKERFESWEYAAINLVLLTKNADEGSINSKIKNFFREHLDPETTLNVVLQAIKDVHLYEYGKPGLIKQIYMFSIIAIFILLLASINFMNLSTARASKRIKEVSIRKVVGAVKKNLVFQFLGESVIISFIALGLAIILVELTLPYFNIIAGRNLSLISDQFNSIGIFLVIITLLTGIFSGGYPAFYISSFQPIRFLKGNSAGRHSNQIFRKTLTIFQFTISIVLIISTIIVHRQINYIKNKDIGLNRDLVISIPNNPELNKKFESYRTELVNTGFVQSVTSSATSPFDVGQFIPINWESHYDEEDVTMRYTMIGYDYFKTLNMSFVSGRTFSREILLDNAESCVINETAARLMGFDSPLGKEVFFKHPSFPESLKRVRIIGVVKDFHSNSMHNVIGPFLFRIYKPWQTYVYIKLNPGNTQEALAVIEETSIRMSPEYPFSFEFLDDSYNRLYNSENRLSKIFNSFSILTIFVSCLGLFGLTSYTVEQRTKEIGIRKVLGASISNIVQMLSMDFIKWVFIANAIAWPLASIVMTEWLKNFAYRFPMEWWIFIMGGGISIIIAILTVSLQTIIAAMANPVEALRYE